MIQISNIMHSIQDELAYQKKSKVIFRKSHYGNKNKNKKFRVLCNKNHLAKAQGLMSTLSLILPNIIEAREHGYIPVVDLRMNRYCSTMLQEQRLNKKENAWEYYFTQPDRQYSLEEVQQSRYVDKQIEDYFNPKYYIGDRVLMANIQAQYLSRAIRQNIHLQQKIKDRVLCEKRRLLRKDKILGIGIRAGYRRGILANVSMFNGHPIVGSCVEYIKDIEKRLSQWNYNSFFLEVDDREYLEEIKKYFGSSCIFLERPRIHYFKSALEDIPLDEKEPDRMIEFKEVSVRRRNEDYLVELYLLACCDSLYASRGTGHNFSYLLNNGKYSYVEFIDSGEFHYK